MQSLKKHLVEVFETDMMQLVTILPLLGTFRTFSSEEWFTVKGQIKVLRNDVGELAVT